MNNISSGATATTSGVGAAEPRFMKVDGVLREVHGDQEAVRVVTRNYGDNVSSNLEQNQEEVVDSNLPLNEKIILDLKRRRLETNLEEINMDQNNQLADGLGSDNGPKKVDVAGSGFQARQIL